MAKLGRTIVDEIKRSLIREGISATVALIKRSLDDKAKAASPFVLDLERGIGINLLDFAELVHVPGGSFEMGPPGRSRKIHVDAFWIYKYPVTPSACGLRLQLRLRTDRLAAMGITPMLHLANRLASN